MGSAGGAPLDGTFKDVGYLDEQTISPPKNSPVAADLEAKIWECLAAKTVRGLFLPFLLLRLANRKGVSFPLAIVGGTVRDLLRDELPNDVDIAVGGTFDELKDCLHETFTLENQSLTEQDLVGTKQTAINRRFGQLKIMNSVRLAD